MPSGTGVALGLRSGSSLKMDGDPVRLRVGAGLGASCPLRPADGPGLGMSLTRSACGWLLLLVAMRVVLSERGMGLRLACSAPRGGRSSGSWPSATGCCCSPWVPPRRNREPGKGDRLMGYLGGFLVTVPSDGARKQRVTVRVARRDEAASARKALRLHGRHVLNRYEEARPNRQPGAPTASHGDSGRQAGKKKEECCRPVASHTGALRCARAADPNSSISDARCTSGGSATRRLRAGMGRSWGCDPRARRRRRIVERRVRAKCRSSPRRPGVDPGGGRRRHRRARSLRPPRRQRRRDPATSRRVRGCWQRTSRRRRPRAPQAPSAAPLHEHARLVTMAATPDDREEALQCEKPNHCSASRGIRGARRELEGGRCQECPAEPAHEEGRPKPSIRDDEARDHERTAHEHDRAQPRDRGETTK